MKNRDIDNKIKTTAAHFDISKSVARAAQATKRVWKLKTAENEYSWTSTMERMQIIRQGVSYDSIETISQRMNVPVASILPILGLPTVTYNRKRKQKSLLNIHDSEIVLMLTELIDFGLEVFNKEEDKFQRWLQKPNASLGGNTPESLFDSATGIEEVRKCLSRLEYGNLA